MPIIPRYLVIILTMLLMSFCNSENSNTSPRQIQAIDTNTIILSGKKNMGIGIPAGAVCLKEAYPDFIESADSFFIYFKDGSKFQWSDGIKKTNFDSLLDFASLEDMMSQCYKAGRIYETPIKENYDPGRIRYEPLFKKMYGTSKSDILNNLVTIDWYGRKLKVTKVNGVNKKLDSVKNELGKLPLEFHKYFTKTAGTFNYRKIAGTDRISAHSFGIALDINTEYSHYWRWQKPDASGIYKYINNIPLEIVEIFEKYGFIWGGKWYHFDTMHFEYRPELLTRECMCNE